MSVGWPATGLSSSSASVWAKPVPQYFNFESGRLVPFAHRASQGRGSLIHVRQLREDRVDGRLRAREHRRVALGVEARLRVPQAPHQIDELLRIVRVERDHEI